MLDCRDYAGLGKIFVFDTEEGRLVGFQLAVAKKASRHEITNAIQGLTHGGPQPRHFLGTPNPDLKT